MPEPGEPNLTPSRHEPSAEQQAILALTGDSKVAADASARTPSHATAASNQRQQMLDGAVGQEEPLLTPVLALQQQVQAGALLPEPAAVSRQLSEAFADEISPMESVAEDIHSMSDSIDEVRANLLTLLISARTTLFAAAGSMRYMAMLCSIAVAACHQSNCMSRLCLHDAQCCIDALLMLQACARDSGNGILGPQRPSIRAVCTFLMCFAPVHELLHKVQSSSTPHSFDGLIFARRTCSRIHSHLPPQLPA